MLAPAVPRTRDLVLLAAAIVLASLAVAVASAPRVFAPAPSRDTPDSREVPAPIPAPIAPAPVIEPAPIDAAPATPPKGAGGAAGTTPQAPGDGMRSGPGVIDRSDPARVTDEAPEGPSLPGKGGLRQ